jgi:hypothetical protein
LLQLANRPKQVIVLAKCRDARYFWTVDWPGEVRSVHRSRNLTPFGI